MVSRNIFLDDAQLRFHAVSPSMPLVTKRPSTRASTTIASNSWTHSLYFVRRQSLVCPIIFRYHYFMINVATGLECKPHDSHIPTQLVIRFDAEHYPILPSWDDDEGKPLTDLKVLLRSYLDELWSEHLSLACLRGPELIFCHRVECIWPSDDDIPTTPWGAIETSPEIYFDATTLPAGVPLVQPESLTRAQVYMLVEHIHSCQSAMLDDNATRRFTFRSKAEIQGFLNHTASPDSDSRSRGSGSNIEESELRSDGRNAAKVQQEDGIQGGLEFDDQVDDEVAVEPK